MICETSESRPVDVTPDEIEWVDACRADELWDGEMESVSVGGKDVLLVKHGGEFVAFQGNCPHQSIPLVEGVLEDGVLSCRAHLWQFDVTTGRGINPGNCKLRRYPIRIVDQVVQIGTKAIKV